MNKHLVAALALLADGLAAVVLWPRLPERVPVHWNFAGEVDRTGSRWELLLLGPGLILVLWLVLSLVGRIDPKASVKLPDDAPAAESGTRDTVVALVLALLALVHIAIMLHGAGVAASGPPLFALLLAAFQLLLGNWFPRLRPNFFVGIRTPWTLSSDQVWRRTHRLAGRLLVVSGLVSGLAAALLPFPAGFTAGIILLLGALGVPAVLSFVWWRKRPE